MRRYICKKSRFPPEYKWRKCGILWAEASKAVRNIGVSGLSEHSAIKVKTMFGPIPYKTEICYNPEHFSKHGWCEIDGSTDGDLKWGFCSPSCSFINDPVSTR